MKRILSVATVTVLTLFLCSNLFAGSLSEEKKKLKDHGVKCSSEQKFSGPHGRAESWICYESSGKVILSMKADSQDDSVIRSISLECQTAETQDIYPAAKSWLQIIANTYGSEKADLIIEAFLEGKQGEEETDKFVFVNRFQQIGNGNSVRELQVLAK